MIKVLIEDGFSYEARFTTTGTGCQCPFLPRHVELSLLNALPLALPFPAGLI